MIVNNKYLTCNVLYGCQNGVQAKLQKVLYIVIDQDNRKDGIGQPFLCLVLNVLNQFAIDVIHHPTQTFVDGSCIKAGRDKR